MATPENPEVETGEQNLKAGAEAEPTKPTEEAAVTTQADQEPGQEVENLDAPVVEKAEGSEADDDNENTLYLELDDKEYSLDEIRTMRDGHMMQSDYTKKTTEHAQFAKKERAEIASDRENLLSSQSEVSDMRDQLAVLVAEDEEVDWVELKEEDPEKYIEQKEKADKRKAALEKVKAERLTPVDDPAYIQAERQKFWDANPEWKDENGETTEAYKADTKLVGDYVVKYGFDTDEFSKMSQSNLLIAVLKAAKYDALQEKGKKIKEKRKIVPLVTKPKATTTGGQQKSNGSVFFPNVK